MYNGVTSYLVVIHFAVCRSDRILRVDSLLFPSTTSSVWLNAHDALLLLGLKRGYCDHLPEDKCTKENVMFRLHINVFTHWQSFSLCPVISHHVESATVFLLCAEELWCPDLAWDETWAVSIKGTRPDWNLSLMFWLQTLGTKTTINLCKSYVIILFKYFLTK